MINLSQCRPAIRFYLFSFGLFVWILSATPVWAEVDFREIIKSVVMIRTQVPPTARTAKSLGTARQGSGIVIDDQGLVLTIGYLVMEAEQITLTNHTGKTIAARFVAYDHATGFGLVRALEPVGVASVPLGTSAAMAEKSAGLVVSLGGFRPLTPVEVVSRRPFAGYWEYLLDSAIFTMPVHRSFGGAALINGDGQLVGVGSLFVNDAIDERQVSPGNMFVPVDLLKPILAQLIAEGRRAEPPGPWLGVYLNAQGGRVFVARVADGGPAEKAGIKAGDIVMGVGGKRVADMADFYRRVRQSGVAGVDVPIDLLPLGTKTMQIEKINVKSADRYDWLKMPKPD